MTSRDSERHEQKRTMLNMSQEEASRVLTERIEQGNLMLSNLDEPDLPRKEKLREFERWNAINEEMLRRMFTTNEYQDEYSLFEGGLVLGGGSLEQDLGAEFENNIAKLETIREKLSLIPEANVRETIGLRHSARHSNRIFLVHGHDEASREKVARFLERAGFEVVILHEKPNRGQTLIEKMESNSDVSFAVVLLTPDDLGKDEGNGDGLHPRARQNVILELGFFCGRLGRARVCALYMEGVEIPSDFDGVVYTPLDAGDRWRSELFRELVAAGFAPDSAAL